MAKTISQINERIKKGEAMVVTAEEIIDLVEKKGKRQVAREVDVVTTGTFAPMCSSGVYLNLGHSKPKIKAQKVWLNSVPAYGGLAAVDVYLGATELREDDPANAIYPGLFPYGGGHVIEELVAKKDIRLKATSYGTDCYPRRELETLINIKDLNEVVLFNPRNAYQNYPVAVNLSNKTIYTYMGILQARLGNATYCSAGQLSPLLNDPYYKTIGLGTRIFLGGGTGFIVWQGTQHNPGVARTKKGVPKGPGATLAVLGDLKKMGPKWLRGVSMAGYGVTLAVGIGIPIPILNEEILSHTAIKDEEIYTQVVDYSGKKTGILAEVDYAQLKSGKITIAGKEVPTSGLSSYARAKEIAELLKKWIEGGRFLLSEPVQSIPGPDSQVKFKPLRERRQR